MTDFSLTLGDASFSILLADKGVPGPPGAGASYEFPAAAPLSGHRAVKLLAGVLTYCDANTLGDAALLLGMTTGAIGSGTLGVVVATGEIVEPSWSWTAGPVFVGANGALTQVTTGLAFLRQIGFSPSPQSLILSIGPVFIP